MRLCVVLLAAALGCLSQQTAGKPIGMEDTIADVVSRILEGSDKEKTEAITLVLQLLTEIDLPSLCKSIGDDPTEMTSVDDIVARAATARHTEATTAPVMVSDTDVDLAEQNNTNMNWKTDSTSTLDVAEKEFTSTDEALEETKDDMTEAASKEVELNAEVEVFQEISLTATVQAHRNRNLNSRTTYRNKHHDNKSTNRSQNHISRTPSGNKPHSNRSIHRSRSDNCRSTYRSRNNNNK
ncbi:uncharacterized protein LOC112557923 isoform X3 [Pomacea canaliculata]|uniref:uncharacterized protein LOC112557923 isoform X3 n=1 Tax=Pomacea canaliculata TaxID=400727 RepID=UPI000D727D20|nr:uncharacterized protein LOC112557923 isoform X3 [Pomacea canaliculata]